MIKPKPLKKNSTIGIINLASPIDKTTVITGFDFLKNLGFNLILSKNLFSQTFPIANAQERAADLMSMFTNPKIDMILSARGGTSSSDILPFLDYELIKKNPKIFCGYSDLTLLLNYITQKTKLITFHGLMLNSFSDITQHNLDTFFSVLSYDSNNSYKPINNPQGTPLKAKNPGCIIAPITGGNLVSIINSLGTPYELDTKDKILFLEDIGEPTRKIYRMLTHLQLCGKLTDAAGFLLGEFIDCDIDFNTSEQILDSILIPLGKPIISNFTSSHGLHNTTFPIGSLIKLDASNEQITLYERPTK